VRVRSITQKHLEDAATLWEPILRGSGEEDEYWDWVSKSYRTKFLPGDELYAIECDGTTQGLMTIDILKKRCYIESQLRRRLVYIRALATAPWNRLAITNPPTYKEVGGLVIDFAIARSEELGYQGRIGLHALRCALVFYRNQLQNTFPRQNSNSVLNRNWGSFVRQVRASKLFCILAK
jgi:hypothetical protein